ncbi:SAGA complex subunit Sgf73 [Malassezia psittaci]|uniref:SAGA complex subunit Sgf73 n=1 Tax=Malassezia psittaci TaxID=1821823 RepID=A0AAF0FER5_9BASI|nr:SAGA complex subunit Sgf73 [Malassezia psittaci]
MIREIQAGKISTDRLQNDKLRSTINGAEGISDAKDAPDTPQKKKVGGKKNRGPINLDRQCGVINNKGLPCSRSLTCKSHSMGAKRNVAGRSQPYDTLLFEWQKATNPAFVARLEEKERAIAAAKATNSVTKDKKRKSNLGADRGKDPETELDASGAQNSDNLADMYFAKASYMEVERDLRTALQTIHRSATRERTSIVPMAVRSFAGQYTTRTRRFRALRQLLAQGLSGTVHRTTHSADSESSK